MSGAPNPLENFEPGAELRPPLTPLAVTTSDRRDRALVDRARAVADARGLPFLRRNHPQTLAELLQTQARALLVFEADAICLIDAQGVLRFSPGLAHLRIKQLDAGVEEDMLVRFGALREGEQVLDCTLGLAGDAQVAARLVGPRGRVVGLEKSLALSLLVEHGLKTLERHPRACSVDVHSVDAGDYLRAQPDGSFDAVLFDPMFGRERRASAAFETLRRYADYTPLTPSMVAEAQRVARRVVLIKGSRYSTDFKKLGLEPLPARRSATVLWARLGPLR